MITIGAVVHHVPAIAQEIAPHTRSSQNFAPDESLPHPLLPRAGCSAVGRSRRTGGRPSPPRCRALELVRVATRATRGPTPRTGAGFGRTRERGRADPRGERAREREERLNFGGGARQAGLAGLAGDARDARGYHYDREKVRHGCLRRMCPQYCPKFSLLLLLLQEAVEPSPVARRTTGVQAEARRSGEAGEADRGQLRAEPRLVRNHPPTAAARGSSSLCCCVLLQGSGGGRGAGRRSEAKTRSNWRSVMTQIATKYVADPHKYGDGSGYGGR